MALSIPPHPLGPAFEATAPVTRFAPSPTGYLHLGHVLNALHVWGAARAFWGKVLLRMEDHDQTRCKPEFEAALLEDLEWLGLSPDLGPISAFRSGSCPWRQTDCLPHYQTALDQLAKDGHVYACDCSRQAIRARHPQPDEEELTYDGHCRDRGLDFAPGLALRVRIPHDEVAFHDLICGPQQQQPSLQCGDFVLRDRNGNFTYQFAVVLDDIRQGVNLVVRGQDLLASTGRQVLLQRLLGMFSPPIYAHHALLLAPDGRKMSKRDFSADIHQLKCAGIPAAQVIGEVAHLANWQALPQPMELEAALEIVSGFYRGLAFP
jgi:glutamyl-Q tRNA(Asp) synthetase